MTDRDLAARLALASLPGLGPARGAWLLAAASPSVVVHDLQAGRLPALAGRAPRGVNELLVRRWTKQLRTTEPSEALAAVRATGVEVLDVGHERWPFHDEPEPPMLLFTLGNIELLRPQPRVALVGTRRCTSIGREVAHSFGVALAEAGIPVISGLASGIDGAAHRGVLSIGDDAIGVVGTGLDVVYPGVNRTLWHEVAARGLLLSEAPPGTKPERWRFPARNRLIAALADVLVVIESHASGGSLITAEQALDRSRNVMAVPGSVTSAASRGTNRLLADGCHPACQPSDVLEALGFAAATTTGATTGDAVTDSPLAQLILSEVAAGAVHIDDLVAGGAVSVAEVLAAVHQLSRSGAIDIDGSTVSRPAS